jgi:hypothetical protein
MNKKSDWDVNIQTDGQPLPVKGNIRAEIALTPETAATVGALGGGTLGYLLGPKHKGWRAVTTLASALLGGYGSYLTVSKLASQQKQAKEQQYAPKGAGSYTNIGQSPQKNRNPLSSIMAAFGQSYAGDPTGRSQYQVTKQELDRMSSAWSNFKASQPPKQPVRGFVNPYAKTPTFFRKPAAK